MSRITIDSSPRPEDDYEAPDIFGGFYHDQAAECDTCAAKPGSPTLCPACLHNRDLVARLQREVHEVRTEVERLRALCVRLARELANEMERT